MAVRDKLNLMIKSFDSAFYSHSSSASGLVVKFNVAIVEPRVRFSAGAKHFFINHYFASRRHHDTPTSLVCLYFVDTGSSWSVQGSFLAFKMGHKFYLFVSEEMETACGHKHT